MKKWEKIVTVLGAALFLYTAEPAFAFEPFYLNGDQTQPMIQNTGGIYNDGKTGLFMDLTSMTIEGVFNDGLAVRVKIFELAKGKSVGTGFLHVRYAEDGKAWVLRTDDCWQEVASGTEDPSALAVYFVREEMGNDARRDTYMSQIEKLAAAQDGDPGSIVPANALPASFGQTPKAAAQKAARPVKGKSVVRTKPLPAPHGDVTVTITEAPQVEIVKSEGEK